MKNLIVKSFLVGMLLNVSAFAYEATKVDVEWIGFKTNSKVGVTGTFNHVDLQIKSSANFNEFINSAKVKIDTSSLNSKMKFRDTNIISTLFNLSSTKEIIATVKKVNGSMKSGELEVEIVMNNNAKTILMKYDVKENNLIAKGSIDILDFSMHKSFNAFSAICKPFHEGKTWSEVSVSFDLFFTK